MMSHTYLQANSCIHSHSPNAVLVTLLYGDEFAITHIEMIKVPLARRDLILKPKVC